MKALPSSFLLFSALVATAVGASAQSWELLRPSTTGIPGEEVRQVRFAPDGLIWVGARWPFWGEGGYGLYDRASDSWTTYSNADGTFASAFPNDIAWAPDGSVWIGTGNGLVHIEGTQHTVYTSANSPLLHNAVGSVAVGLDGHVWLNNTPSGTNNAAIFEFDGSTWRQYTVGVELPWDPPWNRLSDVMVDHLGHVWVANSVLNGVAEFDGVQWTLHGEAVGRFGEMEEDTDGNIWLRAGVGGGNSFWKFDRTSFTHFPIATTPTSIGIDDDGAVFLGDWLGNVRKTTNGGASFTLWASGLNQVFDISPDPQSTDVWIGTNGAVGHFNGAGQLLRDFNSYNTGMGDYFIDDFDVDREGNVWIAAGESGLTRFDGFQWRNWGNHNVGSEPYPFAGNEPMGAFYLDTAGVGWMGGNGIARWDPVNGTFDGFWNWQNNPSLGVTMIVDFAEDAAGRLFACNDSGRVFRFENSLWVAESFVSFGSDDRATLTADSQGDVWYVTGWEIWRWDGAAWSTVTLPNPNYLFDLGGISCAAIGPGDVMWIGTPEGLVRWDRNTFELFDKSNSALPALHVTGVDVRADGVLGLSCMEFGPLTPFPNGVAIVEGNPGVAGNWSIWQYGTSPLPHYQLGKVRFDAEGNLWVSAVSESAAVLLNSAQALRTDTPRISSSVGGQVQLEIHAGPAAAGELYALLGTLSGTEPGVPLPGGTHLPLVPDPFTNLLLAVPGFVGSLDGDGRADVPWTLPAVPPALGLQIHFAHILPNAGWQTSNPVSLTFTP